MSDWGLELRNAAGVVTLRMTEAMPRLVHSQKFAWDHTGTLSVPGFDTDFGMFYVSPCAYSGYLSSPGFLERDDRTFASAEAGLFGFTGMCLPSLDWNNATKVMTIAPATFPPAWPYEHRLDYVLNFIALGRRFSL